MDDPTTSLPTLLAIAWLLPLASFAIICVGYSVPQLFGTRASYATSKLAAYVAIGAIGLGFLLSTYGLFALWLPAHPLADAHHGDTHHAEEHHDHGEHADQEHAQPEQHDDASTADGHAGASHPTTGWQLASVQLASPRLATTRLVADATPIGSENDESVVAEHRNGPPPYIAGDWYTLGQFGGLTLSIGYYIDTLTLVMFCMVTLIATCVHVYAVGYMHDELHDFTDSEVEVNGQPLQRPGRFHRFFQYLSLFSFSMLGLVVAGNLAMVFVFWELVGICSYFLIGFYIERKSASSAANKAFIVNRIGDFGMLIGLMAVWASLGTFAFGDVDREGALEQGIFSQLRTPENEYRLVPADGMVALSAGAELASAVRQHANETDVRAAVADDIDAIRAEPDNNHGQWLLFVAGVGLFCGCVGKSAQFPLHVWLPDAMEGPTPVSALVHSATMVAAGVYLVGRIYPLLTPEALLVIAIIGCITLFVAATIAVTQTDIKRVLAYSTVSQLGYMMLALGLGGWVAGLFHLITHAFFKGLLFLCSGSVIHAVHSNEMTDMGGLRKKMPITAYTMLVGCLAIIGAGIPLSPIGLSGYHSKDSIIEQALYFAQTNGTTLAWTLFVVPVLGAVITAFYMFRLWYMTFTGEPRDQHRYDHAHESPTTMTAPLILLAVFAVFVSWSLPFTNLSVTSLLDQAYPVGTLAAAEGELMPGLIIPNEHDVHTPEKRDVKVMAGLLAFSAALFGLTGATVVYLWKHINANTLKTALRPLYELSWHKWWFDELYHVLFVIPVLSIGWLVARFDRGVIDGLLHVLAWMCQKAALLVGVVGDKTIIDGTVDTLADRTWQLGKSLHAIQTGRLRQYVMFSVICTVVLFIIASMWWRYAVAAG